MKKIFTLLTLFLATTAFVSAQVLPSVQFGLKAGANLTRLSTDNTLSSDNRAGYLAGFWARFGGAGVHFQPEIYVTGKNTLLTDKATGDESNVKFTSIDLPLLIGTKVGAVGLGGRLNTGPVVSFVVDKNQTLGNAAQNAARLDFKDQAIAWQFGAGLDIQKVSLDLRYELGLSNLSKDGFANTKINMFNLSLGYRLF